MIEPENEKKTISCWNRKIPSFHCIFWLFLSLLIVSMITCSSICYAHTHQILSILFDWIDICCTKKKWKLLSSDALIPMHSNRSPFHLSCLCKFSTKFYWFWMIEEILSKRIRANSFRLIRWIDQKYCDLDAIRICLDFPPICLDIYLHLMVFLYFEIFFVFNNLINLQCFFSHQHPMSKIGLSVAKMCWKVFIRSNSYSIMFQSENLTKAQVVSFWCDFPHPKAWSMNSHDLKCDFCCILYVFSQMSCESFERNN